jgi:hypothetical protein
MRSVMNYTSCQKLLGNQIKKVEIDVECSIYGEKHNAHRISVEKPEENRRMRRGEDNIKMNLKNIGWENVDWINLAQDIEQ